MITGQDEDAPCVASEHYSGPPDTAFVPQELYKMIFEQCPSAMVVYDTSMRIVDCNDSMARGLGTTRDRVIGLRIDDLRDQRHRAALERALGGEVVHYEASYHATTSNRWLLGSAMFAPLRDRLDEIIAVMVLARERTWLLEDDGRERSDFRLGEAQRLGRVGSWTWDIDRGEAHASPEFFRILGVESEQLTDPTEVLRFVYADDRPAVEEHIRKTLAARTRFGQCEFRVLRRDASVRWVVVRAEVAYAENGRPASVWGTMQDVTERRDLQEQLQRAQRMEPLALLAGGAAHDFNNLLTIIQISTDFLERGLGETTLSRYLFEIRRATEHAARLTRQLLVFSRKQILHPRVLDLNELVSETSSMLRRLIGEDIELVTTLDPDLCTIVADPGQLHQVLMNLAVNARDAMPKGGVLHLHTSMATVGSDDLLLPPGRYVVFTIADTGHGMDESVQRRIFDPFFTTKPTGKGTGLGLSTVLGIVEQSGGTISVSSEPGRGARFTIHLPCGAPEGEPEDAISADAPPREALHHATALLVEDEAPVCAIAARVLQQAGFTVLTAEDGYEALAIAHDFSGPIDLLITDMVLPGLNGRRLAERLRKHRPEMRVVYTTGYADDEMFRRGLADERMTVLEKPFSAAQLVNAAAAAIRG